jgi:outer membrane protein assembly factor BamB
LYKVDIDKFDSYISLSTVDKSPDPDKYLTKKLFIDDNNIFYSSDTGKIFYYNILNGKTNFLETGNNIALIGTPVKINDKIFFINSRFDLFVLDTRPN